MRTYGIDDVVRDLRRTDYANDAVRQVIFFAVVIASILASWYFVWLVAQAVVNICG